MAQVNEKRSIKSKIWKIHNGLNIFFQIGRDPP